jgi:TonB-linked SusC/RagA family outer membrane protein
MSPALLFAQTPASRINGRVTDAATGEPLEGSRVLVVGTGLIETASRDGRYTLRNVPPGQYQVRVLRIGYQSGIKPVSVMSNETATLDFALPSVAFTLDELVVTSTGEQRKLEVANATSTIDAASVTETGGTTDLASVISGRAAGVQVLKSGGATGTGSRLRIRGSNSISLSNEPLYYIDGIRMESEASGLSIDVSGGTEGGATSRINDINPDDIADIEIVKGPAAATLYGIQASNGVVRITTKRGTSGPPRWNFYSELGTVSDPNTYPLNFFGVDSTQPGFCILQFELTGLCTQTGITKFSPLEDPASRPYKAGLRQQYGANVSGGNDFATYFIAGSYENEAGAFRLPRFEEDSIRTALGSVPASQVRPNTLEKVSLRTNLDANLARNLTASASLGYISSDTRLVQNDNSFLSITASGESSFNPPDVNRGWFLIPAEIFAELSTQGVERFTGGLSGNWQPLPWLTGRATFGYDVVNTSDVQFLPSGQGPDLFGNRAGFRTVNHFQDAQTSVDLGASAQFRFSPAVGSKTSFGVQYFRDISSGTFANGQGLAPGSETIDGAAITETRESTTEDRSIGSFVEQQIDFKNRLFLTGALRFDDNSAFGKNFNATVYPKGSASWLVSDEPFFHVSWINTLRVRGAFGVSGQQPGTTDARRAYFSVPGRINGENKTGVSIVSLGNADLKPERSRELEFGLDLSLFHSRVTVEFTHYHKTTKDALISKHLAPSLGTGPVQFVNLGKVTNQGIELVIGARVVDKPALAWDVTLSGSTTKNRLVTLGEGNEPIIFGFGIERHVESYPLDGYWDRPILSFADANNDGVNDATEYVLGDTAVFAGTAIPTKEASLNTSITLFQGRLRLGSQFDYRGGHLLANLSEAYRCNPILNCRGLVDRTAPLREQAAALAVLNDGVYSGYFEPAWFIKLRELSLTYDMPGSWARKLRASRLSVTFSARNLWTITDYSGVDPEVNAFGQSNFAVVDYESQPQVRYYTVRLNLGF